MEYLYHYTSVDVLALILKNRTIRLNPFSKTENNLLMPVLSEMRLAEANRTRIMQAILMNYPETSRKLFDGFDGLQYFRQYKEKLRQEHPTICERLIESSEELQRNITTATPNDVDMLLRKVEYTDEPRKLYPQLYQEYQGQLFGDFSNYGAIKNTSWAWQKEWRYIVCFYRMRAFRKKADDTLQWYDVPFDYYDLKLDPNKLNQLEVMTSPVMTAQSKSRLQTLLDMYLPGTPIVNSALDCL